MCRLRKAAVRGEQVVFRDWFAVQRLNFCMLRADLSMWFIAALFAEMCTYESRRYFTAFLTGTHSRLQW